MGNIEEKPRVIELRPSIYQFRSERPGSHVYLIKGTTKNIMVDTGTASNYANLVECLRTVDLAPPDINLIILTHEHFDHIGAARFFFEKTIIAAHVLAANKIELQDEFVMMGRYLDHESKPFRADLWLRENSILDMGSYKLRVLHTPGHCSGCICLYECYHKLLFTGDTVLAGGVLSGILGSGNVSDYISSLQRLGDLHIEEFYPGHGRISLSPAQDLQKALEDSIALLEESKALFEALDTKATYDRYFRAIRKLPPAAP